MFAIVSEYEQRVARERENLCVASPECLFQAKRTGFTPETRDCGDPDHIRSDGSAADAWFGAGESKLLPRCDLSYSPGPGSLAFYSISDSFSCLAFRLRRDLGISRPPTPGMGFREKTCTSLRLIASFRRDGGVLLLKRALAAPVRAGERASTATRP
jgi:hypothetical protein